MKLKTSYSQTLLLSYFLLGILSSLVLFFVWFCFGNDPVSVLLINLCAPFIVLFITYFISTNVLQKTIIKYSQEQANIARREKSLVANAADVICLMDINAIFQQVSPAAQVVFGYLPEEMQGHNLTEFIQEHDNSVIEAILNSKKSIDRVIFETKFRCKLGNIKYLLWSAHWSVSDSALFCVAHDITERKEAEQKLRESELRVRQILENLPAAVVLSSSKGAVKFLNKMASNLLKLEIIETEKLEKNIHFSLIYPDVKNPLDESFMQKIISESSESAFECQLRRSDGEKFSCELSICRFQLNDEPCYLAIFVDLTFKQEVEQLKRELIAIVSHDLRTPLNSVSNTLDFMQSGLAGDLNEKGRSLASKSYTECRRLIRLVQDLLDLEKMRSGKFVLNYESCYVEELINAAIDAVERVAQFKDVSLEILNCEELKLSCDKDRIVQVLVNLLDNAIKYSPVGQKISIEFALQSADKSVCESDYVCISVHNFGKFIPEDKIISIFDRFEQVDENDQKIYQGSGLGLSICKTLVLQHQGKIDVYSEDKKGTTFKICLPISS